MTERWFGATGRKVPAVVLEGSLDLSGALVVDSVEDAAALRRAHEQGVPVAVRADDVLTVATALARPEVSCVVVTDARLLDLDLAELTYG